MNQTVIDGMVGMAMLIGVVGVIVPLLPGTAIVAVSFFMWAIFTGGPAALGALVLGLLILGVGMVLKYLIPKKSLNAAGVPNRSLALGGMLGIVGFFVIPVLGLPIGFVTGVYAAEHMRLSQGAAAREATWVAMRATGMSMLIELAAALLAMGVWATAAVTIPTG